MTERGGLFLTFEGVEGCGKSTQARLLCQRLRELGYTVVETVEPGGTKIGKQIRAILLEAANLELSPAAELLLFFASRAQLVDEVIVPALNAGHIVVSDRFVDSSFAYQGVARGLGVDRIRQLESIACRGLKPALTLCLDLDAAEGLARARRRNAETSGTETRLDDESLQFHQRVRDAYHQLAEQDPDRVRLVDASPTVEEVSSRIWEIVKKFLSRE